MADHGTNACYVLNRCRRPECVAAKTTYNRRLIARRVREGENGRLMVPVAAVKRHLRSLSKQGIGYLTVAELLGVAPSNLSKIAGQWDASRTSWTSPRGPRRIHADLARRILAVTVSDVSGGQKIPAEPTWRLLDELIALGWTKSELARRITGPQAGGLQIRRTRVRASTARKVESVYREIRWYPVPKKGHRNVPDPRSGLRCRVCGDPLAEHRDFTVACVGTAA